MFSENQIVEILTRALPGAQVRVSDLTGTKDHFRVEVTSPLFQGKPLIAQHQMVIQALKENISDDKIHALSIKTKVK